jgi:hypothetical protein
VIEERRDMIARHRVDLAMLETAIEMHRLHCAALFSFPEAKNTETKFRASLQKIVERVEMLQAALPELEVE